MGMGISNHAHYRDVFHVGVQMTDPVIANPLPKPDPIQTAETDVKADIGKVESIWKSYEVYIVAAICLIVGAIVGHKI
jgi:hypothetical protein